jgi:hypothetical protein
VQRRHRPGDFRALEPISHDQVVAFVDHVHERRDLRPIVRIVGVAHDDDFATRLVDTPAECRAISLGRFNDDASTVCCCDLDRPVGRAVIRDDDFPRDA